MCVIPMIDHCDVAVNTCSGKGGEREEGEDEKKVEKKKKEEEKGKEKTLHASIY